MPRTRRRIPATTAEVRAWWWGASMFDAEVDWLHSLASHKGSPEQYHTEDSLAAWDRLGPVEFWTWALAGFEARAREDQEESPGGPDVP